MREPTPGAKQGRGGPRRVEQEDMELTRKLENAVRTWLERESARQEDAEAALF